MNTTARTRSNGPKHLPFNLTVPEPLDRAFKTAADKVEDATTETQKAVKKAAASAKKVGVAFKKDPKSFVSEVVRESRDKAGKARVEALREANRIAQDIGKRVGKALDGAVQNTLHGFNVPTQKELKTLTQKVDALSRKIDMLAKAKTRTTAKPRPRTARKPRATAS